MLIDADLRNPGLTRDIARQAEAGILEAIRGERPLRDLLLSEPDSGLFVLPAVIKKRVQHSSEILSSPGMRNVLAEAGAAFDYIVVDLPPLGPVVDVRAAASMFDAFLFVVEWGRTPRVMVQNMLTSDDALFEKCVGVLYNKVNMKRVNLYENYGSKDYYYSRYSKYYHKDKVRRAGVGGSAADCNGGFAYHVPDPFCDRGSQWRACRFARWFNSPSNADIFDLAASIEKGALPDADYLARFVASAGLDRASIDCGDPFTRASLTVNLAALQAATEEIDEALTDVADGMRSAPPSIGSTAILSMATRGCATRWSKPEGRAARLGDRRSARVLLGGAERGLDHRAAFDIRDRTSIWPARRGFETEYLGDLRRFVSFESTSRVAAAYVACRRNWARSSGRQIDAQPQARKKAIVAEIDRLGVDYAREAQ